MAERYWKYTIEKLGITPEAARENDLGPHEINTLADIPEYNTQVVSSGSFPREDPTGRVKLQLKEIMDGLCEEDSRYFYRFNAQSPSEFGAEKAQYLFDPATKKGAIITNMDEPIDIRIFKTFFM